ncbi:MAG TPA: S9 family peptidase [Streptosporangiaceae bacterium]|jgi:oligopeptidase B
MTTTPPPVARRIPAVRSYHGDTFTDEYAWLADKDDPEVLSYLKAENAFTDAELEGQAALRETVFGEIKARTQETDLSVPVRRDAWWYYSRTVQGQQYQIHCRRAAAPSELTPPLPEPGEPLAGEQVLLDGNEVAAGHDFFALGAFSVSPDGGLLGYSTDFAGNERFTLRVKDLTTGALLGDEIPDTHYGCAWSRDGSALFYITADEAWRPCRLWRHTLGTPASDDVLVYEEADERFRVGVWLTRSQDYLVVMVSSAVTSEAWLLDAAEPAGPLRLVAARRQGVEYDVDHQPGDGGDGRLLILHNHRCENFELATAPAADPGVWTPLVAHRADTRLLGVSAFAGHFVLSFRRGGLTGLAVHPAGEPPREIEFPEPVYTVHPGANPEYHSTRFRLGYTSMVTPDSVYDCDVATGELTLLKRRAVLPAPDGRAYDPAQYTQAREWAVATDGTRVPISLVYRAGTPRDGSAPCLLYGYGSYEASTDPFFSVLMLSLLDRGFIWAIAHVRGGGEMGRHWYEDGKLLHKKNTFTDFVACARHLVSQGWTSPSRLIARGGSAGGLLMGAVANLAPGGFAGIVAEVPFVDPLNSMLDPTLPLTVTEWEEWGDPLHDPQVYAYMKSYSPYENVASQEYPPILVTTGLNDTRVLYHEPAKWVAQLRAAGKGGPFLLRTRMEAGHGGRSGRYDAWREWALVLAWIAETAGAAQAAGEPGPG